MSLFFGKSTARDVKLRYSYEKPKVITPPTAELELVLRGELITLPK